MSRISYRKVLCTFLPLSILVLFLPISLYLFGESTDQNSSSKYTIRVNTFRRPDLLKTFLNHYTTCKDVKEIQIIWSDQKTAAPIEWVRLYPNALVTFEIHKNDSLSNRFRPLLSIKTDAVASLDDDLIITCAEMSRTFAIWRSNIRALVGYSPRLNAWNPVSGQARYLRWQHTWWNGLYSIVLTKVAFLHKRYLQLYKETLPAAISQFIDDRMNCEDIVMAHLVAVQSEAAPVWAQGNPQEGAASGISSGKKHFDTRSQCLQFLHDVTPRSPSPWVIGYQKVVPMNRLLDLISLMYDTK